MRFVVGIDEVGRGPLAGPVSIGIVVCRMRLPLPELSELHDSKQMTAAARERVAAVARGMRRDGAIAFGVYSAPAREIDGRGIEAALSRIIAKGLAALAPDPDGIELVLDGRLHAPERYRGQTIVHGDSLVPAIMLASVVAKVARDAHMTCMAEAYPGYGFAQHKGYGTAAHCAAIRRLGPSPIHRMTFLSRILDASIAA